MKTNEVPLLVVSDPKSNITDLIIDRVNKDPKLPIMAKQVEAGVWVDVTAGEYLAEVRALAKGFIAAGIEPGQRIGIMSHTRYEWALCDFALWFAGAVSVPIYESSAPSQIEWILGDSGAVAAIFENNELFGLFQTVKKSLPQVNKTWTLEGSDLSDLIDLGTKISDEVLEARRTSSGMQDLSTIIYTSGTTGQPKGCELLHQGFVDLSRNAQAVLPEVVCPGGSTVLFLPMAHVFARFVSVLCVAGGVQVGHQPDAKNVASAMQSFHPTFLLAVPRVFEKVYNSAEQRAEAGGKGKIFHSAAETAIAWSMALDTKKGPSIGLNLKHKLFDALVYKKLRAAMGGQVKYAISGGGPLGARLGHFYRAIGLIVLEGYGLTETTAPVTIGRPNNLKIGKVGFPLPGCGVQIADDGEIWLRGTNVLKGYWNNPQATESTFEGDWFKTGDIGALDEDGFLAITGRKKELIITAGGKNVAPALLEDPLRANPLISQAVVIGDAKPFVSVLISLDEEMLPIWLENSGIKEKLTTEQAITNTAVLTEVSKAIEGVNSHFSTAESIRKFALLPRDLTEKSGHLTPSLKIKRSIVIDDYSQLIDDIYADSAKSTCHNIGDYKI
ncbi:MAG: long-chain fatty acid--CoA ligase [Micrococcales bacterium]|nr:long-chain fatty acid--CoA ligase [Actinomycetota bacterium]NCA07285.1 long-chain fatty acid--CoA ligase [Micrococcales bacterium]